MTERNATDTIRLYETDATIERFTATVLACQTEEKGYEVLLDRTAFFPTGGGQGCDLGWLGEAEVCDVAIKDGRVIHTVSAPLAVGIEVEGRLDTVRRRRHMTAHTAEHILSSVLFRRHGLHNVGFHLGHEDTTCDFDGMLDDETLVAAEDEVNAIIRENHPVYAVFPSLEELETLAYRSKLALSENVRIVVIGKAGDIDRCACCAPHVAATGEIGLMRIVDAYRYKGGMRIHLLTADEALRRVRRDGEGIAALSSLLSAKPNADAVIEACQRLWEENKALKASLAEGNDALNTALCRSLPKGKPICLFDSRKDVAALRRLAAMAYEAVGAAVLVLGAEEAEGHRFVLCGEGVKSLYTLLAERLPCRGGGNDRMICGSLSASRQALEAAVGDHFTMIS